MDTKRMISLITAGVLGAVWVIIEVKHQTPPQALNQAIVAALGAAFASGVVDQQKKAADQRDGDSK